jgi:hypothetical protein
MAAEVSDTIRDAFLGAGILYLILPMISDTTPNGPIMLEDFGPISLTPLKAIGWDLL